MNDFKEEMKRDVEDKMNDRNERLKEELREREQEDTFMIEDFDDTLTTSIQQDQEDTRTKSILNGIVNKGLFTSWTNLNTETVSMYSIAEVVDVNSTIIRKLIVSIGDLFLVCLQSYFLTMILNESSHEKCNSIADCPTGNFCTTTKFNAFPTCADCIGVLDFEINLTYCSSQFPGYQWGNNLTFLTLDHTILRIESNTNSTLLECLSYEHCKINDLDYETEFEGHCDFIALNMGKIDPGFWLLIGFFSLLWALPVCQDIEEAAIEEKVLDHHIGESFSIPAEIMRVALRIRRFILPLLATSVTVVFLVTDEISTKNIVLNFLSITFILEADNILALLFLKTRHKDQMEEAVQGIEIELLENGKDVSMWARIHVLFCVVKLIIELALVNKLVRDCDRLNEFLNESYSISLFIITIIGGFYKFWSIKKEKESTFRGILEGLLVVCRNAVASNTSAVFSSLLFYFLKGNPLWIVSMARTVLFQILFFGSFPLLAVLEICKRKCKEK